MRDGFSEYPGTVGSYKKMSLHLHCTRYAVGLLGFSVGVPLFQKLRRHLPEEISKRWAVQLIAAVAVVLLCFFSPARTLADGMLYGPKMYPDRFHAIYSWTEFSEESIVVFVCQMLQLVCFILACMSPPDVQCWLGQLSLITYVTHPAFVRLIVFDGISALGLRVLPALKTAALQAQSFGPVIVYLYGFSFMLFVAYPLKLTLSNTYNIVSSCIGKAVST